MSQSLGARLRQRREEQHIALSTIVDQTKIKLSWLEALERDDVSRWPSGIFGRAFVRAYAHAIGMEPDVVVKEFLELHPDPFDAEAAVEAAAEAAASDGGAPPMRIRSLVGAAVGSLSRLRTGAGQPESIAPPAVPAPPAVVAEPPAPVVPETIAALETAAIVSEPSAAIAPEPPAAIVPEPLPVVDPKVEVSVGAEPDLAAAAYLCTEFGRLDDTRDPLPLLHELAKLLDAVGLIVWVWDPQAAALVPTLPCGYSNAVLAQLPNLPREARNATAAAFRSGLMSVVSGGGVASDALVVPLIAPAGCTGVLAIELQPGGARTESVRALATIFAAQMARVIGSARSSAAANRRLA
jgi:hypothetical protein